MSKDAAVGKSAALTRVGPFLFRNEKTGVYSVRRRAVGRIPSKKSTGQTNRSAAQTVADELLREWLGPADFQSRSVQILQVVNELEQNLKAKVEAGLPRPRTWEHDQTYLKLMRKHFGDKLVRNFTERSWEDWVSREGHALHRTLFDLSKYVSKILTFAVSYGYIRRKPTVYNPDWPKRSVQIFENSEIEWFMAHSDLVLRDLILIAAETGLRPDENRGLRWAWVEL